jgi:GPH family glycoside/pentoside/hexuronide:cation symporter
MGGSLFLRFAMSTFQLPFIALGAELSNDYIQRSSIAAFRLIFSIAGPVAVIVLAYQVFLSGHEGLRRVAGYAPLGWSAAAIVLAGTMLSVLGSRGRAARMRATPVDGAALYRRLGREVVEIFKNPSFRLLFLCGVTFYTAQGVSINLNQDLNLFVWKLSSKQIQTVALTEFVGLAVGLPIAPLLSRWFEKRSVVIIGLLLVVLGQGVLKGLRGLDLFTLTGQAAVPALAAANFLVGLGVAFAAISIFSMMGDAADEHDFLFESRREGLYFAGLTFAAKTATGLGALLAGLALDAIAFPRGAAAAHAPASAIAPTVLDNLCLVAGPAVAIGGFVAMTLMAFYRINRRRHAEVVAALNARDEAPA